MYTKLMTEFSLLLDDSKVLVLNTFQAYNGIGLSSLAISWAFTVDASPPIAGHVFDGQRGGSYKQHKDVDYVADSTLIYVYWEGFHDPHTPIHEYIVQVGSCENCDDVLSQQPVGFDTGK